MSGVTKKLMSASGGVAGFTAIEDVFSTYLYTGNGGTQTITNGIDLAGEGGLVWTKNRNTTDDHMLEDSENGPAFFGFTNKSGAFFNSGGWHSHNADGFNINTSTVSLNASGNNYASWTFRKAPRFFDVVTYTGDGVAGRQIAHNLGTTVGSIIIKRTETLGNWAVYHRGNTAAPETDFLSLNLTNATADDATYWNDTAPTDSVFTVGTNAAVNASGGTYVAYLFAHDPLGPSEDGSDGLIACGSYTGTGAAGNFVELGFEPQWLLVKASSTVQDWTLIDTMRGMTDSASSRLNPNNSQVEATSALFAIQPNPTGFTLNTAGFALNGSGHTYIYIAIRRGPMRAPTSGTEVFAVGYRNEDGDGVVPGFTSGFPVDMAIRRPVTSTTNNDIVSRLTGNTRYLRTNSTTDELSQTGYDLDYSTGWFDTATTNTNDYSWMFRRAPEFFDVVAYTGNGQPSRAITHSLKVSPELVIVKQRSAESNWFTWCSELGNDHHFFINQNSAVQSSALYMRSATDTVFNLGTQSSGVGVNSSGVNHIMYLFATLAGISKVGSYAGNGSSQTINCGFTTGARLVLIKATSTTGDWLIADTARGIVAGNDPYLELNTTNAEVTSEDWLDPDSSGFVVNAVAGSNANTGGVSYIFYAVA